MSVITDNYQLAFDEINSLAKAIYKTSDNVTEDLLSVLINAYQKGCKSACDELDWETFVDLELLEKCVYKEIEGKTFEDRALKHIANEDLQGLITLTESEFHRVFNQGCLDGATYVENDSGMVVFKKWDTMLDNRVRATHDYLEGMSIPLNDDFYTFDGDHASAPGNFTDANNNVNCRCVLEFEVI